VAEPVVLVDARNVLRSQWPNVPEDVLVERCRRWAEEEGVRVVVAFDGRAPCVGVGEQEVDERVWVAGCGKEICDDWLVRRARELADAGETVWLVTSDRGLRERVGEAAARRLGGGAFLRSLPDDRDDRVPAGVHGPTASASQKARG
jgi:predicted RNA-binding protein with PIN domain